MSRWYAEPTYMSIHICFGVVEYRYVQKRKAVQYGAAVQGSGRSNKAATDKLDERRRGLRLLLRRDHRHEPAQGLTAPGIPAARGHRCCSARREMDALPDRAALRSSRCQRAGRSAGLAG